MESTSIARGISVGVSVTGGSAQGISIIPTQILLAPVLSVQGIANTGDSVAVAATTSDADGFATTAVQLLNGASVLGSMTNSGGSGWTFSINAIATGTYTLIARRVTASGTVDSTPHVLVVASGNQLGNINVNSASGAMQNEIGGPNDGTLVVGV